MKAIVGRRGTYLAARLAGRTSTFSLLGGLLLGIAFDVGGNRGSALDLDPLDTIKSFGIASDEVFV